MSSATVRKLFFILTDFLLALIAVKVAYIIRFGYPVPPEELLILRRIILPAAFIQVVAFYITGLYSRNWSYPVRANLVHTVKAIFFSFFVLTTIVFFQRILGLSRVVLVLDHILVFFLILSLRLGMRLHPLFQRRAGERREPCLIIGAGDAGRSLAAQMISDPRIRLEPVAFLDDDRSLIGKRFSGIPVVDVTDRVREVAASFDLASVIVSIPSARGDAIRRIVSRCRTAGLEVRIVPGIREIIEGDVRPSDVRPFKPEDLLGRETVEIAADSIRDTLRERRVLVTGAAGSIGSELVRQLRGFAPGRIIAIDQDESGLFRLLLDRVEREEGYLADISDGDRVAWILERERPDIIFHAAAYKHVPILQTNVYEAVKTNIVGTINLARLAQKYAVDRFIFISTDKAVESSSVMGMSKRVGEMIMNRLEYDEGKTRFSSVRFGNVLLSNGSVVPVFEEQIKRGGPVTVTDPEMVRYFMTISEAVRLVLQSAVFSGPGALYVLDMGEPVRILDLARTMIALYGNPEVEIRIIGPRPGEKLREKLFFDNERTEESDHPSIKKVISSGGERLDISELERFFRTTRNEELLLHKLRGLTRL